MPQSIEQEHLLFWFGTAKLENQYCINTDNIVKNLFINLLSLPKIIYELDHTKPTFTKKVSSVLLCTFPCNFYEFHANISTTRNQTIDHNKNQALSFEVHYLNHSKNQTMTLPRTTSWASWWWPTANKK